MSPSTRTAAPARCPGTNRRGLLVLLASLLLLVAPAAAQDRETLVVETAIGAAHAFRVELAQTDAERGRGLMFRRSLAPDAGMLFDFGRDMPVSMWMKNTYIPLDMLFITSDGRIRRIEHEAAPESLTIRSSGGPVRAVLELAGGTARRLGIRPGDRVRHPLFANAGEATD